MIMLLPLSYRSCIPDSGNFEGTVRIKDYDDIIGPGIPQVELQFIEHRTGSTYKVTTDTNGTYSRTLEPGCYWVMIMHIDYEDYSSIPVCEEIDIGETKTLDFTLRPPVKTTVLLVRHAERSDDDLLPEGIVRRDKLAQDLLKSGVTAIYSSMTTRTRKTVQGLADMLSLPVIQEHDVDTLVNQYILSEHKGDTVLVASHSGYFGDSVNSVPTLILALGGRQCEGHVSEYDNLYVVTKYPVHTQNAHVINLQYGEPQEMGNQPDFVTCPYPQTFMLLVALPEDMTTILDRAKELAHAVKKADLASIWVPYDTVPDNVKDRLSDLLPQAELRLYRVGNVQNLLNDLFIDFQYKTSLVIASQADLSVILEEMQVDPMPMLDAQEFDNLFVITGISKMTLLNIQYGSPSP